MFTLIALAALGTSVLHALATKQNVLNASDRFANAQAVVLAQQEVEVSNVRKLDNQRLTSEFSWCLLIRGSCTNQLSQSAETSSEEDIHHHIPVRFPVRIFTRNAHLL